MQMYANILENGELCLCNEDFGNGILIENFDPDKYYYMDNGKLVAESKIKAVIAEKNVNISEELRQVINGI